MESPTFYILKVVLHLNKKTNKFQSSVFQEKKQILILKSVD